GAGITGPTVDIPVQERNGHKKDRRNHRIPRAALQFFVPFYVYSSKEQKNDMIRMKPARWFAAFLGALFACASGARARDIGGTISATLTITEDSQLVDDVTCTVTGAPCIS